VHALPTVLVALVVMMVVGEAHVEVVLQVKLVTMVSVLEHQFPPAPVVLVVMIDMEEVVDPVSSDRDAEEAIVNVIMIAMIEIAAMLAKMLEPTQVCVPFYLVELVLLDGLVEQLGSVLKLWLV
jgi:hypothetical protein